MFFNTIEPFIAKMHSQTPLALRLWRNVLVEEISAILARDNDQWDQILYMMESISYIFPSIEELCICSEKTTRQL